MSLLPTDRPLPRAVTDPIYIGPDGRVPCTNCTRFLVLDFTAVNGWNHDGDGVFCFPDEDGELSGYIACPMPPTNY